MAGVKRGGVEGWGFGVIKVGKVVARFVRYEKLSDGSVMKRELTAREGGRMVERMSVGKFKYPPRLQRTFPRKTVAEMARKVFVVGQGFTEVPV